MHVALLAPMRQELRPLVRRLRLARARDDTRFRGRHARHELVAALTGIGTRAATQAATALLATEEVDHLFIVGIAGGVDPSQPIGATIAPAVVVDVASGRELRPTLLGDAEPRGRLLTSDHLVTDPAEAARLLDGGVVGLDMETAAIAAVCEARGCPWSVFRAISDRVSDGTTDPTILALAGEDGSGDLGALLRLLARRPGRVVDLVRLARGTRRAVDAAAGAAIRALDRLSA